MKNLKIVAAIVAVMLVIGVAQSWAEDVMLSGTVKNVLVREASNGNEYVRLIINRPKSLNGFDYMGSDTIMAFEGTAEDASFQAAKVLTAGEKIENAACTKRLYNGSDVFYLIKFVGTDAQAAQ